VRLLKRSESEFIMTTKKSVKVDGEFLTSLFETKANEILAKESKKKATKKVSTEKSEVKAEKPKTKKTVKANKKADTETVKKDEKITKKPATKKVTKKAEKPAKEQAEKPKKVTKKAKAEVYQEQEKAFRRIEKPLKIAKSTYKVVTDINNYDELLEAVESEREIAVAFDCSEVSKSDYENIFHVPYVNMKDNFDVCEPIFIGDKVPRLVFASIYSEALWDLFPEEFDLASAVLEK
jgi:isoform skeletal 2 of triadin